MPYTDPVDWPGAGGGGGGGGGLGGGGDSDAGKAAEASQRASAGDLLGGGAVLPL